MSQAMPTTGVHVRAPGKLNLFFEVGPLGDDGYHDVASAYQAVSLYEDVWAEPSDAFTIAVSGSVDVSTVPCDDRNLAVRAARMVAREVGYRGGVHLDIVKNVPVAGGMGGGSADAAAALVAVDALLGADLGTARLLAMGAKLGADVPFALMGGTAIGTGRGDELRPALAQGRFEWVIVTTGDGLSTPEVYGHLDAQRDDGLAPEGREDIRDVEPGVLHALRAGDARALAEHMRNDLQVAALALRPELRTTIELGERSGALAGIVSGSGPTIAFLAEDRDAALDLQISLAASGYAALHVHGPVHGARVLA
ncbi:4-(cytidine 5'-diphospho)-2-C-methyl-D-erythritol kinase [Microbacterium sp. C7(2022)]|uniref:4-(cytidine 5'-diphospho)-2-C-methyl-D-erythritol kinase n=1 Tax=Microbacterium sp. C7(2022) TaxID=2992759 RepID=UPI00237A5E72|nr:4-(cytidine 5'-diphospho)-2-C-methyl-D-erythritol kinase [Microbacterium sp. C7(2022)]MDE0545822.1 4-(cytidine 5'-diphospho)-2-C-methyl-D-erythritol kinase [Microbacterium sp. C7(2022)]